MKKVSLIAMGAALATGAAASADFVSFEGAVNEIDGFTVIQMYAVYDTSDIALNVFNAEISSSDTAFNHSDYQAAAGGSWVPTNSGDVPGFANSAIDSYVTVGYGVGAAAALNSTALDPNFLDATGGLGGTVPSGAGWYNGNPPNDIFATAQAGFDYAVLIGQFVFTASTEGSFSFNAEMGSKGVGSGEVFFGADEFTWNAVPAPGALALLGLGGLAARRRRG